MGETQFVTALKPDAKIGWREVGNGFQRFLWKHRDNAHWPWQIYAILSRVAQHHHRDQTHWPCQQSAHEQHCQAPSELLRDATYWSMPSSLARLAAARRAWAGCPQPARRPGPAATCGDGTAGSCHSGTAPDSPLPWRQPLCISMKKKINADTNGLIITPKCTLISVWD